MTSRRTKLWILKSNHMTNISLLKSALHFESVFLFPKWTWICTFSLQIRGIPTWVCLPFFDFHNRHDEYKKHYLNIFIYPYIYIPLSSDIFDASSQAWSSRVRDASPSSPSSSSDALAESPSPNSSEKHVLDVTVPALETSRANAVCAMCVISCVGVWSCVCASVCWQ